MAYYIIPPSIDPLSEKNKELSTQQVKNVFEKLGIPQDRPILLQVSRFDYFKDPIGVIKVCRQVKKRASCRLILAGGIAEDNPEGSYILKQVKEEAKGDLDIHILNLPPDSFFEINALQRGADIVIQKSLKEGFGLTVTEALWKTRPVIGGNAGGIKLQIKDGENGFLIDSIEETTDKVEYLLKNSSHAREMGEAGRKIVKDKFLITRYFKNYLRLIGELCS